MKKVIKTLYLGDKVICEYESTGSDLQDIERCNEILRKKGLYKETSKINAMFGQANSFATTANEIYENKLKVTPSNGASITPFIVNTVFSIELYMKTIHKINGKDIRGHDLIKLYAILPDNTKNIIRETGKYISPLYKLEKPEDISIYLESFKKAFEEWRYRYEYEKLSIDIQNLRFTMRVFFESCLRIKEPMPDGASNPV